MCNDALGLYAVADGMGGHLGGERASLMAVQIVESQLSTQSLDVTPLRDEAQTGDASPGAAAWGPPAGKAGQNAAGGPLRAADHEDTRPLRPSDQGEGVRRAISEADRAIYEAALADPAFHGMGTTLTVILFQNGTAYVGHVGDSRAYLFRGGTFHQLTEDHSWIQDQVRAGILSVEEAKESRFRNIITRSVGFEPAVRPDMQEVTVEVGDRFLICSDGLSNHLSTEEIGAVVTSEDCAQAPEMLISMANARGGDDNITCVSILVSADS